MTITLDTFKSPEFRGNYSKLPICQLLNGKNILFIKLDNMKLSGWVKRAEVEDLIKQLQSTFENFLELLIDIKIPAFLLAG
ncbi:MAG: hypothetical protein KME21_30685 [Desmonostoc vinosum HA7617-LM4]|jgi:hypothetical protein|nr:hypothetical protein [Desmonostoc vinosum HA7617-LM4]